MKWALCLLFLVLLKVHASAVMSCPYGQTIAPHPMGGMQCQPLRSVFPPQYADCIVCQQQYYQRQMQTQPWPYQQQLPWAYQQQMPWWAYQGQLMYPNFNQPGAWQYPGMQSQYYPGENHLYAAKPNVYVKNTSQKLAPFSMKFHSHKAIEFLATTPWLTEETWSGLVTADTFRVDNVKYDYLFYDVRLPHESMQFKAGWCVDREKVVPQMMDELKRLSFSAQALKDFEEHWQQKIPNEPVFCVYPQYNAELDPALNVTLQPQVPFIRVLFILVPKRPSDAQKPVAEHYPPLPREDQAKLRPTPSNAPVQFMEWGVAFFDKNLIK